MSLAALWRKKLEEGGRQKASQTRMQTHARANEIIRSIPARLKGGMRCNEPIAVMELESDEFTSGAFHQPVNLRTLRGAAREVAKYCRSEGLFVYICGEGMDGRKPPVEMMVLPNDPNESRD